MGPMPRKTCDPRRTPLHGQAVDKLYNATYGRAYTTCLQHVSKFATNGHKNGRALHLEISRG